MPRSPWSGQKPHFLSVSKFDVVAHQRRPSLRPSLVQVEYCLPRKTKGKTHSFPAELPPTTVASTGETKNQVSQMGGSNMVPGLDQTKLAREPPWPIF